MIRDIVQTPRPILRQPSKSVFDIDHAVKQIIADLLDTMRAHHAYGLSAVQIGVPLRIIALSPRCGCPWMAMVNPEIMSRSGDIVGDDEGCMSIGMGEPTFRVKRYRNIEVMFSDRSGVERTVALADLAARVVQHEVDHLNGILIDAPTGREPEPCSTELSSVAS